jgi:hypothetical protein
MQPKYENSLIYKIVCLDPEVKDVYVGSTTNLIHRKFSHKHSCNNQTSKDYNRFVYRFIRENGGFDNWLFIVVRQYNHIETKSQLMRKERKYTEKLKATLNKNVPSRTPKEYKSQYYKDNKDTIIQEYKQTNKEKIQETSKLYKQKHKEQISEYNKQYHEQNKASIQNRHRVYYE